MKDMAGILAEKTTDWLEKKSNYTEYERIVIKYGLELILENIMKAILLISVAFLMDKVQETFLVIGVFSVLRLNAGGIHMRSSLGCSLSMLTVWAAGVFGSKYIVLGNELICVFLIFIFISLFLFAPCDTKNNPITDVRIRTRKKWSAIVFVAFVSIFILLTKNAEWKALMFIPIFLEIITILPIVNYINQLRFKEENADE